MVKNLTLIGIDGGGSKTRGTLRVDGVILSDAISGTTRIGTVGFVEAAERLLNIILELCSKAEIDTTEVDAHIIGVAGVWLQEEKSRLQHLILSIAKNRKVVINDVFVTSDAEIALEGALGSKNGGILIGGTGTITLGKVGDNKILRCGGWGIELDDEGSGAWIGREGLTAVVRALDGRGESTILCAAIEERFPTVVLSNPRSLVSAFTEKTIEYHSITPLVMNCAENGDLICKNIVIEASNHLSHNIHTLSKLSEGKIKNIVCMGGMLDKDTFLSRSLFSLLDSSSSINRIPSLGTALDGAISLGENYVTDLYNKE